MKHLLIALSLVFGTSAFAAPQTFSIDADHTTVGFKIRHLVSKISGTFSTFSGTIVYDDKDLSKWKLDAEIDAESVDTNQKKRDDHLRSADFFDTDKHPKIKFVSKKATGSAKSAKVTGDLTIHGITKSVTLNVTVGGIGIDPWGNKRIGMTATTKVNRKDFGLNWNKALEAGGFLVGDDVEITLEVEGMAK